MRWWISSDYDRYIGIISGPRPYSHLGSGPLQLYIYGFLIHGRANVHGFGASSQAISCTLMLSAVGERESRENLADSVLVGRVD
jgi:hypothetical protein